MPHLFTRLPQTVVQIFSGRRLLGHALAILLTFIIVESGFDWSYYLATRGPGFVRLALPAVHLGFWVPLIGPITLLLVAMIFWNRPMMTTAWAMGQAIILGYLTASTYKAFTGRLPPPMPWRIPWPPPDGRPPVDLSHGFQLGFWRGGIFWGWPSSHTTVAFSLSTCLIALYPKNKVLVVIALLYALYIGLGVSVTIHWCSEFVAGAIFGSVIGTAVGKSFRTVSQ